MHVLGWFGYKGNGAKSGGGTGGGSSGVSGGGTGGGSAGRMVDTMQKRQGTGMDDLALDDDEEEDADDSRPCRQMSVWRADEENQITTTVSHGSQQGDEKVEGKTVSEPKHCPGDEGCEVKVTSDIAWGSEQR
jgi:hypothetical protein